MKSAGSFHLFAIAAIISLLALHAAQADDYPARPIKLLVGAPAGGTTDTIARAKENHRRSHDRGDDWNASYESDNGPRVGRFAVARDSDQVDQFVILSARSKVLPLVRASTSSDRCAERAAAA